MYIHIYTYTHKYIYTYIHIYIYIHLHIRGYIYMVLLQGYSGGDLSDDVGLFHGKKQYRVGQACPSSTHSVLLRMDIMPHTHKYTRTDTPQTQTQTRK